MTGLKKYAAIVNGYETTLILSDEDAEAQGFTTPLEDYTAPEPAVADPGVAAPAGTIVTAPKQATKPARRPARKKAPSKKSEPKPPNKAAPAPTEKGAPAPDSPEELAKKIESA